MGLTGDDQSAQRLHDRATRGHALTGEEYDQLDAWYAAQDVVEAATLRSVTAPADLHDLQVGVEHVLVRLITTSHQIQELATQNANLRAEIADLQQRVRRQ